MFGPSQLSADHDQQFIQIFFHHAMHDELDTFNGTYTKDLIPGKVTTEMWLTTRDQEILLTKAEAIGFFELPDTLNRESGIGEFPDFGAQTIRIKHGPRDKTVVWFETTRDKRRFVVEDLRRLLIDIIRSKPEYKALPPAKGAYI